MKIAGVILWIITIVLLCVEGFLFVATYDYRITKQNDEQTTALVTGNERHPYYGNYNEQGIQYYYCAKFKFQTQDGRTISVKQDDSTDFPCSSYVSDSPNYQVGQQVPVYYDPSDPAHTVQIAADVNNANTAAVVIGVIVFIFIILCAVVGSVLFVMGLAKSRQ
jgi:hypothetical protein